MNGNEMIPKTDTNSRHPPEKGRPTDGVDGLLTADHPLSKRKGGTYPLMPVMTMPCTKRRWARKKTRTMGITTMVETAIM